MWSRSLVFVVCSCFLIAPSAVSASPELIQDATPRIHKHDDFGGANLTGVLGFARVNAGNFGLYYEHLFAGRHGLYLGINGVHVHQVASYEQLHLTLFGGEIAYRLYASRGRGLFFGVAGTYRRGFGRRGERDAADRVDFAIEQMAILPQVGYRWVFETLPISIVASAGVGYGPYQVSAEDPGMVEDERFARDVLGATSIATDLAFSVAYGF